MSERSPATLPGFFCPWPFWHRLKGPRGKYINEIKPDAMGKITLAHE